MVMRDLCGGYVGGGWGLGFFAEDEPEDHADDGEQQDDEDPDQFFDGVHAALEHVDDGNDVEDENDQAGDAVYHGETP